MKYCVFRASLCLYTQYEEIKILFPHPQLTSVTLCRGHDQGLYSQHFLNELVREIRDKK